MQNQDLVLGQTDHFDDPQYRQYLLSLSAPYVVMSNGFFKGSLGDPTEIGFASGGLKSARKRKIAKSYLGQLAMIRERMDRVIFDSWEGDKFLYDIYQDYGSAEAILAAKVENKTFADIHRIGTRIKHTNARIEAIAYMMFRIRCSCALGEVAESDAWKHLDYLARDLLPHVARLVDWNDYANQLVDMSLILQDPQTEKIRVACNKLLAQDGLWSQIDLHFTDQQKNFHRAMPRFEFAPLAKSQDLQNKLALSILANDQDWPKVFSEINRLAQGDFEKEHIIMKAFKSDKIAAVDVLDLVKAYPNERLALKIQTSFYHDWAFQARGGAVADLVGQENFQNFEDRLHKIVPMAEIGLNKYPDDPHYVELVESIKQHIFSEKLTKIERQAFKAFKDKFRDDRWVSLTYLNYKFEKWGGSYQSSMNFAKQTADKYSQKPLLGSLVFEAEFENGLYVYFEDGDKNDQLIRMKELKSQETVEPYYQKMKPYLNQAGTRLSTLTGFYETAGNYDRMKEVAGQMEPGLEFNFPWYFTFDEKDLPWASEYLRHTAIGYTPEWEAAKS